MATTWQQVHFRTRNDDGSETTATWKDVADTNLSVDVSGGDVYLRIRFNIRQTGTTGATFSAQLWLSYNGGAYAQILTTTLQIQPSPSANFADDAATTQQISAGTFIAGKMDDATCVTGSTASMAQNRDTELEFMLKIPSAHVFDGDTIDLRVRRGSIALATYSVTPRIAIVKTSNVLQSLTALASSLAFTKNISSGNTIIAAMVRWTQGVDDAPVVGDISKSAGTATLGSFTLDKSMIFTDGSGQHFCIGFFRAAVTGSGSCTLAIAINSGDAIILSIFETDGTIAGQVDGTPAEGTGNTGATAVTSSFNTAAAGLIIGILGTDTGFSHAITPSTDYQEVGEFENGGTGMTGSTIYRITSAPLTGETTDWTITSGDPWVCAAVTYIPASSGISQAVGQVTETDIAQAITKQKVKLFAQVTETDAAQATTVSKSLILAQVTESDISQTVLWPHVRFVGKVLETNPAQVIVARKMKGFLQVAEIDLAQSWAVRKTRSLGQAMETDLAQSTTVQKRRAIGQVSELDISQPFGHAKRKIMSQVSELEIAQAMTVLQAGGGLTQILDQAVETDVAQALGVMKRLGMASVTEVDIAQAFSRIKRHAIGQASEFDLAQAFSIAKRLGLQRVIEADLALSISGLKRHGMGQVMELDFAGEILPLLPVFTALYGVAAARQFAAAVAAREFAAASDGRGFTELLEDRGFEDLNSDRGFETTLR